MAAVQMRPSRPRWHAPEKGSGPAFALSLLAHALLFIAIAFAVRWKSEPVGTVTAELRSLTPLAAAPQPVPPPPPAPPKVEQPPPEPPRKADIVEERRPPKLPPIRKSSAYSLSQGRRQPPQRGAAASRTNTPLR